MSKPILLRVRALAAGIAVTLAAAANAGPTRVEGLQARASIARGAEGVVLIKTRNERDLAFMQGYAHARDRFYQMDSGRRLASGTLAELLGAGLLASDVQMRTLGLRRAATASWRAADSDMRRWLKAYTDGVNYWLRSTNNLPPEYAALEIGVVEPWSTIDSLVTMKMLLLQLSLDLDIESTLNLARYQEKGEALGFDGTALFFDDTHRVAPPDDRVTLAPQQHADTAPGPTPPATARRKSSSPLPIDATAVALAKAYRDKIADHPVLGPTLKARQGRGGSNGWVVAGSMTASGKPILANDPHLGLPTPSVLVEQHLHVAGSPALNVTGVTLAGMPGVLQGCNDRICWGSTTNPLDVTDLYQENLLLDSRGLPYATVYNGRNEAVEWVHQTYYVNKVGDGIRNNLERDSSIGPAEGGITVLVPRRNRGPLLQMSGNSGLSVAYTGWSATQELEAIRRMNRARNLSEFQHALSYFDVGSQNFSYADVQGNIGYFTSGETPLRADLQNDGTADGGVPPWLIRDGSGALNHEWLPRRTSYTNQATPFEILPPQEMPWAINPAAGYLANANNDPIGSTLDNDPLNQQRAGGGVHYLNHKYSAFRQGRIARELDAYRDSGRKVTVDDMKRLQADNRQLDAELVAPHLVTALARAKAGGAWAPLAALAADAKVDEAVTRIAAWDYSTPTGIAEGYDPGDNPAALPQPAATEIDASVAASLFAVWRSQAVRNTIDATLLRVGLGEALPSSDDAYTGFKFQLDHFAERGGVGQSGLDFFALAAEIGTPPSPQDARDYVLLKSMQEGLAHLASAEFAAAFAGSTSLADYRWGKLHRIQFAHHLGGPFNLPGDNGHGFTDYSDALPGLARAGGYEVVDESSHDVRASQVNDFMFDAGPARRFVGEMTPTIDASQIMPGGPSGVLGSPWYASQLGRWLTNDYRTLPIGIDAASAAAPQVENFVPR